MVVHRFSNFPAINSGGMIRISLDRVGLKPTDKGLADEHLSKYTMQIFTAS